MREITSHKINECNEAIKITADERTQGNASHRYVIDIVGGAPESGGQVTLIAFQRGPIKEVGTNGVTNEALLAILIDRMEGFQAGPYACEENAIALDGLRTAQNALHSRTKARVARGVEGTHAI